MFVHMVSRAYHPCIVSLLHVIMASGCNNAGRVRSDCSQVGIHSSSLLSYTSSLILVQLPEVQVITNELILELLRFKDQHPQCTFRIFYCWLKNLYGKNWPDETPPTCKAVTKSIRRLMEAFEKLKKENSSEDKNHKIAEFLKQEYILPKLQIYKGKVLHFSPVKNHLTKQIVCSQKQVKEFRQKVYAATRNANKKLRRREAIIAQQKACIESQQLEIKMHERKLQGANHQVNQLRAKLNRVNHRTLYWKRRVTEITVQKKMVTKSQHDYIEQLKNELSCLESDNAEMVETLESVLKDTEVHTFEGGRYTDNVRACIYELLSLNVGVRNVAPIIRCVLRCLTHKSVSRLPSYGLTCQMILESLTVAQAQLGDELSQVSGYTTLQTDGTTKFGEHFSTYDIRTEEAATYTLGIRHVFSGSAKNTLETFQEILSDIDSVQQALGGNARSAEIVAKLKNTMSDRHAAEKLFNELLSEYRAEILPTVAKDWENLTRAEREQLMRVNNFFCGLHFLVGLADCAEETLKVWEAKSVVQKESSGSSGTQRLVRTACKAFHHKGSQQCGSYSLFHTYLKGKDIHKIPLAHFVGNRFNILFYDAAGVYFLQDHMIQFINEVHSVQANRLLQSVRTDLTNPCYIVGCRALGLIDKIITGPLWRKLRESSLSVLDMGSVYCEMKESFDSWGKDASDVITGVAALKSADSLHEDEVWSVLTESNENDQQTQELLQILFNAFSVTTQRLLIDHLPEGKHYSVTDTEIINETASVPTTNVSPERDFAILDRLMQQKPNANTIALEAMIMYSQNKTSAWLQGKSEEEKKKVLQSARNLVPITKEKFKTKKQKIQKQLKDDMVRRQQSIAQKRYKKQQEKEKLTKAIGIVGLWVTRAQVDSGLDAIIKKTEKLQVLKLQINFRNKVLNQLPSNSPLFKFSHCRKLFTTEQLKYNLYKLLEEEFTVQQTTSNSTLEEILSKPQLLVGRRIRHQFRLEESSELVWYNGTVEEMNPETNEFQVVYDGEDEVCNYALLDDIRNGDVSLICNN